MGGPYRVPIVYRLVDFLRAVVFLRPVDFRRALDFLAVDFLLELLLDEELFRAAPDELPPEPPLPSREADDELPPKRR